MLFLGLRFNETLPHSLKNSLRKYTCTFLRETEKTFVGFLSKCFHAMPKKVRKSSCMCIVKYSSIENPRDVDVMSYL
jgi:hypothetical protein